MPRNARFVTTLTLRSPDRLPNHCLKALDGSAVLMWRTTNAAALASANRTGESLSRICRGNVRPKKRLAKGGEHAVHGE
jgi:hypothetical protein